MSDKKVGMMVAEGYEEIEMLTVVDLLRRAGMTCDMISVTGKKELTSSHKVTVTADLLYEEADFDSYDALAIPGGLPGTTNLGKHEGVCEQLCGRETDRSHLRGADGIRKTRTLGGQKGDLLSGYGGGITGSRCSANS